MLRSALGNIITFNQRIFKKLESELRSVTIIEENRDIMINVGSNESLELREYIA